MKLRYLFLLLFIFILAYLCFYPVSIQPVVWKPYDNPGFTGDYAENNILAATEYLFEGQCYKCEDVDVDSQGGIYGASEDGKIYQFDGNQRSTLVETQGRPLGLHFDSLGNLITADTEKGLLSIAPNGKLDTLSSNYKGYYYQFTDDLDIAPNGNIYFTDASNRFSIWDYKYDLLEHRPNGSFYEYNPSTKKTTLLLDELYFANGVAVSENGDYVLVCETGAYSVLKYWIDGPLKGTKETFIENLPGFPDGISRGSKGIYWIGFTSPRQAPLDWISDKPFLRKMVLRLPEFLQPKPVDYSFVIGLNEDGEVVYNLQDPEGKFAQISSVQENNGYLYFGSLGENGIGRIKRPE